MANKPRKFSSPEAEARQKAGLKAAFKARPKKAGRPPVTEEQRTVTRLTRTKFRTILRKYLGTSVPELKVLLKDKKIESLDAMVISVMVAAIDKGDEKRIEWLLIKLFGKTPDKKEVKITSADKSIDLKNLSDAQLASIAGIVEEQEKNSEDLDSDDE